VAVAEAREDDRTTLATHCGFGVVALRIGEANDVLAFVIGLEDVVGVVEGPHVALAVIGFGWTGIASEVGRRIDEPLIVRGEEGTCRRPLPARYGNERWHRPGGARRETDDRTERHSIDAVAIAVAPTRLEDELAAVPCPVRFRVLASQRQLL